MEENAHKGSTFFTWVVILLCMLLILIQGIFAFSVVGDRGQPDWDYRPVRDVPGESPYSMYEKLPYPQHVKGSEGE
ncbi:MAG: hypothetical protein PVH02_17325 [Desulfobacteraceae bacterium]|jgi:hypothetical protein